MKVKQHNSCRERNRK